MKTEHQPRMGLTPQAGGTPYESVEETTTTHTEPDEEEGAEDATQPDINDVLESRKRAVTASIEKHKQLQVATAKNDRLDVENSILKASQSGDNTLLLRTLQKTYESFPNDVEEFLQEQFNTSYAQALASISGNSQGETEVDVRTLVERTLAEKEQAKERQSIRDLEIHFFTQNDIDLEGVSYKKIMNEYRSFPVTSRDAAENLLQMLYTKHTGASSVYSATEQDLQRAISPRHSARTPEEPSNQKRKVSTEMKTFMERKFGADKVKKFLKG